MHMVANQSDIVMVDKEGGKEGCSYRCGSTQGQQHQGQGIRETGEMPDAKRANGGLIFS